MGILTPVAVRVGAISWLPRLLPQIVWVDEHLQQATHGRLSLLDIAGLPNLVLTVPGRRSGLPRSTPLLCVPYGTDYLIAGSYFGAPAEPVWVRNLEAALAGRVRVDGAEFDVTARELTGQERDVVWPHMVQTWPNFARYERRTDRPIRVFALSPAGPAHRG